MSHVVLENDSSYQLDLVKWRFSHNSKRIFMVYTVTRFEWVCDFILTNM